MKYGNPLQVETNKQIAKHRKEERELKRKDKEKQMSTEGTCTVKGCENPIKAKRLCDMHYARKLRTGTTSKEGTEQGLIKTCLVIGCEQSHNSHGYCSSHAKYYRETGSPYLPKIIKLCGVKGCSEKHWGRGLCHSHFKEWKKELRKYGLQ